MGALTSPVQTHARRWYTWLMASVASVTGLLFGFDTAVVNGALLLLRTQWHLSDVQSEVAAGALLLGAIAGAAGAGWSGDRFGRRKALLGAALLFAASSLGAALASGLVPFELARFLGGLAIGVGSTLTPVYIAEISTAAQRGRLVTLFQLAIVVGILGAYLLCWRLAAFGPAAWRWMFGVGLVPALTLFGGLLGIPESPRWLAQRGRSAQMQRVLRSTLGLEEGDRESEQIVASLREGKSNELRLQTRTLRRPLIVALSLTFLQQITGINTVLYYGSILFSEHAGQKTGPAIGANVSVGVVNLLGTIIALYAIDRAGRRPLLLCTYIGMTGSLSLLALNFTRPHASASLLLMGILGYVAFFSVGPGPVTWVYISEIFPTAVRGRAVSIATVLLWSVCLLVTSSFLSLLHGLGATRTFGLYAFFSALAAVFVLRYVPETRGQSLEAISSDT